MRLSVLGQDNLDDVEPDQDVGVVQQLQPGQGPARNQFAFGRIDRFNRSAKILASPRFYFDEDEGVAIATNDINFAPMARPKIAVKNFVTSTPKKGAGQFFAACTEPQMFR
jgi:hypothetical protein